MPILGIIASANQQGRNFIPGSYDALATITLAATASSVVFAGIPLGYNNLELRVTSKANRSTYVDDLGVRFNGVTTASYSWHRLYSFGSGSPSSDAGATQTAMNVGQIAGGTVNQSLGMGSALIEIVNYADALAYKTIRVYSGYDDNGQGAIQMGSGNYQSFDPVTSITLLPLIGSLFSANSSFELYGVK